MKPARVLIVDDSIVIRKLLSLLVESDSALALAGAAPNAGVALETIARDCPDLVLLDVEMPGMDGIAAVAEIRRIRPKLPVIMCSSLTERGAAVTVRALAAGATDYIAKPTTSKEPGAYDTFKRSLLDKIKLLTGRLRAEDDSPPRPVPGAPRGGVGGWGGVVSGGGGVPAPLRAPIEAIMIGSSTGGPAALTQILSSMREAPPVPVVIAQHMPPMFTRMLAERLAVLSGFKVSEARDGEPILPGGVYIAPGDYHLEVVRAGEQVQARLNQNAPENACRPAIDVLFRSAAKTYGAGTLAVVLTGMGRDGTSGARAIIESGGMVIVQDSQSCSVPAMPDSVVSAGLASQVVELVDIGAYLQGRVRRQARAP